MSRKVSLFNWSGGKDSTLALHHILENGNYDLRYLLTTVNEAFNRVSMHGVREDLLITQANSIGIPLYQVRLPDSPDMAVYERNMQKHLASMKSIGITHAIFGDIFLEDLRIYRETQLAEIGIEAVFPLWKKDTTAIINEFISLGYQTIVVCAKEGLEELCGRVIDTSFIADLPPGIDPCGENGEFHTFVYDGPIFKKPINFSLGEKVFRSGYWYIDLIQ